MKLNELAVANPTKQAAKVFESYFGQGLNFDTISADQAHNMLKRVRALIAEHRRTPEFHRSEQNPAYLKLVVMEQALATAATAQADPQKLAAQQTLARQQQQRQIDDELKQVDQQMRDLTTKKTELQKRKMQPTMEGRRSLRQRLKEASEVQQAQVAKTWLTKCKR
jgi:hypothetical protein